MYTHAGTLADVHALIMQVYSLVASIPEIRADAVHHAGAQPGGLYPRDPR